MTKQIRDYILEGRLARESIERKNETNYHLKYGYKIKDTDIINASQIDDFIAWYRDTRNIKEDLPIYYDKDSYCLTYGSIMPKPVPNTNLGKNTKKEMSKALDKVLGKHIKESKGLKNEASISGSNDLKFDSIGSVIKIATDSNFEGATLNLISPQTIGVFYSKKN